MVERLQRHITAFQKMMGDHRDQQQRYQQGDQQGGDDRDPNLVTQYPHHKIGGENKGQEHGDGGKGGGSDRTPHFPGAFQGSAEGAGPLLHQAVDIFQHHDAVVEQHPHCQGHADQGQAVQGDVEGVEKVEGGQHRNRQRECNHRNQAQVLQEKPQNQHRQQPAG